MKLNRNNPQLPASLMLALAITTPTTFADQFWDGGGNNNNWLAGPNWGGDAVPNWSEPINFGGNTRNTPNNNRNADLTIGGINFINDGSADKTNGFTLTGNRITLGGNITMTGSSSPITDTIEFDMILNATRRATLANNHELTISGTISGANRRFEAVGGGVLTLSGDNTFSQDLLLGGNATVNFATITNTGQSSNVGSGNSIVFSALGGTLNYTGAGNTSNRFFNLAGENAGKVTRINNNGTGALIFNNSNFIQGNTTAPKTIVFGGANASDNTISGAINDISTASTVSLKKEDAGRWILSGNNGYTGTTTVAAGSLIIDGAVASTSVVVDGSLGGSGVMANATLSGSGSINPGNSPGILTAAAADPSGGLNFNFEFTAANALPVWDAPAASGNDVLRLTDAAAPFSGALGADNVVSIYFNVGSITLGDVFTGGFYTDRDAEFLSSISSGTFQYFLADAGGATTYAGNTYTAYSGPFSFGLATVAQPADFGAGTIDGFSTQFTVIPEPNYAALLAGGGLLALLRRRRLS